MTPATLASRLAVLVARYYGPGRNDIAGFRAEADPLLTRYFRDLRRMAPEQYERRLAELTEGS
jgi:hypothetical protein